MRRVFFLVLAHALYREISLNDIYACISFTSHKHTFLNKLNDSLLYSSDAIFHDLKLTNQVLSGEIDSSISKIFHSKLMNYFLISNSIYV